MSLSPEARSLPLGALLEEEAPVVADLVIAVTQESKADDSTSSQADGHTSITVKWAGQMTASRTSRHPKAGTGASQRLVRWTGQSDNAAKGSTQDVHAVPHSR